MIGRTIECIDQETNPIWGSCSLEIDQSVAGNNNTDNNNNRLGVLLIFRPSGSYTGTEVSYGIKSSVYSGTYLKSLLYVANYGGTIGKYIDFPNFMVDSVGKLQSTYVLMNRPSVSSPSSYAYEYQINGVRFFSLYADNSGRTVFKSTGTLAFRLAPATISLEPETDAGGNIGSASFRLNVVYAATGTINTSDATMKTPLARFDDNVLDAIGEVQCGLYQWLDAVAKKGQDSARFHAGVIAQQIAQIFAERELDVSRYGFWCSDPLFEDVEEEADADDIPVMETYTETEEQITFENGRAVRRMVKIAKERQAIDLLPLFDDQGQPLMNLGRPAITRPRVPSDPEDMPIQEETGHVIVEPAIPSQQRVVSMPRVEKGIRKTIVQRPVLDSEGKHVQRLGLRYDELLILLNAWSRRELARLNDRLIRLEGALAGQN
ncbi:MAG: tail fiber domain-containing protein [Cohnella sp.]|nr:tail fiber domain-containing protein [Cohnella sp.]